MISRSQARSQRPTGTSPAVAEGSFCCAIDLAVNQRSTGASLGCQKVGIDTGFRGVILFPFSDGFDSLCAPE
jgi:hypothetical protein